MLTMRQRIAVTATIRNRYRKARKKKKSQILNEFVKTADYNRSYARYLLGSLKKEAERKDILLERESMTLESFMPCENYGWRLIVFAARD